MCARWLKPARTRIGEDGRAHDSKHSKVFGPLDRTYARMLNWSMAHRGIVASPNCTTIVTVSLATMRLSAGVSGAVGAGKISAEGAEAGPVPMALVAATVQA